MNLQIRFADDTTEERDAASPCIFDIFDPVLKHPSEERWYLWYSDADPPLSFCGRSVRTLDTLRGERAMVWRITDQDDATKALIGEWQSAYVETREKQIERLTAERDAAHNAYVLRDAWALLWKGWAREFLRQRDAESQRANRWRADYDHKQEEWSSSCDILAAERDVEKARADAAEGERDAARRMVVIRSGGIKSSKEARELDALTNQAIEEGWFKVP